MIVDCAYRAARRSLVDATPLCHRLTTIQTPQGRTAAAGPHKPALAAALMAEQLVEPPLNRAEGDRLPGRFGLAVDVDG